MTRGVPDVTPWTLLPFLLRRRRRSLSAAPASAPVRASEPCEARRAGTFVTGPPVTARASARTGWRAPLVRLRCFPSACAGRAVLSEGCRPFGPSRCGVASNQATQAGFDSPLRFSAPCVSVACSAWFWRRRPRGSFVSGFSAAHVPGPRHGQLSRPGRKVFVFRRRSWDLMPLRSRASRAGDGVFGHSTPRTHLPFRQPADREFHRSRGSPGWVNRGQVGRGSWGLAPRANRAVRSAGPAIAFTHRADRVHRSRLP